MKFGLKKVLAAALMLGCTGFAPAFVEAQQPLPQNVQQPVFRVAKREIAPDKQALLKKFAGHPLVPVLEWAYTGVKSAEAIQDYTATFVKRERIDGELSDLQYLYVKVRHQPRSVYTYFMKPEALKGQEAIWVENQNDGKLVGHAAPHTLLYKTIGTVNLDPTSSLAMKNNKYPITNLGFLRLTERIIDGVEKLLPYGETDVQVFKGAKINGRNCTCYQISHPQPRNIFRYHLSRIFVDDEMNVPVRYEVYDFPEAGKEPPLMEEYTYLNIKTNVGLGNQDFDRNNPQYKF